MAGIHHCFTVLNSAYGFRFVGSAAAKVVAHHAWVLETFAVLLFSVNRAIAALDASIPAHVEFNRDVRPILSDNCFHCHGPDKNARQAELRLDIREEAVKTAGSGATPIAPSKPDQSELVRRIYSNNPDEIMPPADSHKTLSAGQKEILKNWIAGGAIYQKHWSFEPPIKPNVAAGSNAIDVLVRKRLSDIGLTASPAADKRTLIRRLYFDLLGLPPSPQDVVNFEGDRSADAYVRLVDRLLQNPHYG